VTTGFRVNGVKYCNNLLFRISVCQMHGEHSLDAREMYHSGSRNGTISVNADWCLSHLVRR